MNIYLKLYAVLYVDDTVLMAETHDDLQNILNKFGEYCNTWRLNANTDKTKVIVFFQGETINNLNTFLMIQGIPTFALNNSFKIPTYF